MLKRRFVVVIVGMAFAAGLAAQVPVGQSLKPTVSPVSLTSERVDVEGLQVKADRADALVSTLTAKSTVSPAEVQSLKTQVDDIKRQLPAFQRALTSAVSKFKQAGLWNPQMDTKVLDNARKSGNPDLVNALQSSGGARALVERAIAEAPQLGPQLDKIVSDLQPKSLAERVFEPLLGVRVYASLINKAMFLLNMAATAITVACSTTDFCKWK